MIIIFINDDGDDYDDDDDDDDGDDDDGYGDFSFFHMCLCTLLFDTHTKMCEHSFHTLLI